ncbi:cobalamin biosynthesis protein CobG [Streptomyces sp. NPDC005955]|uniref:cobalamin biosynthesis protein CobG n=1 Tax=Streptomyces sp. NPDC005955 TaxID=3364738 RepID=UPI003696E649
MPPPPPPLARYAQRVQNAEPYRAEVPEAPPPRVTGDACPGALRLHSADDGALARVRIPGGVLTPAQAEHLSAAAAHLGDGDLHLTSRGNLQLRGLGEDCGAALATALTEAGLLPSVAHERVRNIVASPLSGLDGHGHRPVGPWLRELDALLCASPRTPALSGRFLFAVDDGRGDMAALEPDVTLVADEPGSGTATVHLGDVATLTVPASEAPRTALHAAEAFLAAATAAHATGADRVWRIAELPGGPEAVHALATDTARRTGTAHRTGTTSPTPTTSTLAPGEPAPGGPPPPGALPGGVSVLVPLGRITPTQWTALRELADRTGGELRLTPWRGVVVPGATPADLPHLAATGLVTAPGSPWDGVTACVGHPGCAKSLADVRADAAAARRTVRGLPVHWSGCARRCGRPRGARVDVVATPTGYEVSTVRGSGPAHPTSVTGPATLATTVAAARTAP